MLCIWFTQNSVKRHTAARSSSSHSSVECYWFYMYAIRTSNLHAKQFVGGGGGQQLQHQPMSRMQPTGWRSSSSRGSIRIVYRSTADMRSFNDRANTIAIQLSLANVPYGNHLLFTTTLYGQLLGNCIGFLGQHASSVSASNRLFAYRSSYCTSAGEQRYESVKVYH